MALREENYLFTRRIADRGSDEIVFYSQDRKIQETNPKDIIRDEIVGKEEHPEDGDSYKFQETDSEFFIRDENYGKEEYLGSCSTLYRAPPVFDEYGDEEWYSWVTGISFVKNEQLLNNKPEKEDNHNGDKILSLKDDRVGKVVLLIWESIISYLESWDLTLSFEIEFRGCHLHSNAILNLNLENPSLSVEFIAYNVLKALMASVLLSLSIFSAPPTLNLNIILNRDVGNILLEDEICIIMEMDPLKKTCWAVKMLWLVTWSLQVLKTQILFSKKKKRRLNLPFDPGGFSSKAKLEDEFFFKVGENDAGNP